MSKIPWVVMGPGENESHCTRCGQVWNFTKQLPLDIPKIVKAMKGFADAHENCREETP